MRPRETIEISSFRSAFALAGWGERSIWGWDGMTGSLFVQLWPDGSDLDLDEPPIAIPSSWGPDAKFPPTSDPAQLAISIVRATGAPAEDVVDALAQQAPPPLNELYRQMHPAAAEPSWGGYYRRNYQGLTIYGHVLTKDGLREGELAAGATPAQADATVATVTEAYPRGWRYGWYYSTEVPEGEMGAPHASARRSPNRSSRPPAPAGGSRHEPFIIRPGENRRFKGALRAPGLRPQPRGEQGRSGQQGRT